MGLFRDLGRRAESFKRQAVDAASESAAYECADCDATMFTERETCTECGSDAIRQRAAGTGSDEGDATNDT